MKKDFLFGVAASAYQIEGAYNEDGKGVSIWDVYTRRGNTIVNGENGNIACDHYHRMKEDVALMKKIGVKAYRFSVAWTRILPNGIGEVNQKGIDFYNSLIDELIANGIEPYLNLFHWDLPLALFKKGGMMNREFADWFAEYAKVVVENFSDRVKHYMTFNEPQCIIDGHVGSNRAPGLNLSLEEAIPTVHNMLLAHGKAVDVMRKYAKQDIYISYAATGFATYPASENEEDIEAAREYMLGKIPDGIHWVTTIAWFTDPIILGKYPEKVLPKFGKYLPEGWENDLKQIYRPLDYFSFNYYQGFKVSAKEGFVKRETGAKINSLNWPVTPECIRWSTRFLYERYNLPIYISENGICGHEWVSDDGKVHDNFRIDFIKWHLEQIEKAIADGVDIRGYFYWSFMDNFEWAEGYNERFGLIFVDYETQKRTIKESGYWYKRLIETNTTKE